MVDAAALNIPDIFLDAGSLETVSDGVTHVKLLKVPIVNTKNYSVTIPAGVRLFDMVEADAGPVQLDNEPPPIRVNSARMQGPVKGKFDETCKALNL
jgi:hypothetical protein